MRQTTRFFTILAFMAALACSRQPVSTQNSSVAPASVFPPTARLSCKRVITYSPALTHLMFEMGLGDQVVGVTRWSNIPAGETRTVLGDMLQVNTEAILAVKPDCVFVQQLTNGGLFSKLKQIDPSIEVTFFGIERLNDVREAVIRIGRLTGRDDLAQKAVLDFDQRLQKAQALGLEHSGSRPRVLFVMGTDRPVAAGSGSFMEDVIHLIGAVNAGADIPGRTRWRNTNIESIIASRPDVLLCQSADTAALAPAKQYWMGWSELLATRKNKVYVVTDPSWTIPSLKLAGLAQEVAQMVYSDRQDGAP